MVDREILCEIEDEYNRATGLFGPIGNAHEGYALILEELDELWEEIKGRHQFTHMRTEAIHVATMAIRFINDIT